MYLEALASGVPVLSSAAAGGAELITPGHNGWVVQEVTGAAIARALDQIRDADPVRLRMAARAAAMPFTYAAQVDAFEMVYRRIPGNTDVH